MGRIVKIVFIIISWVSISQAQVMVDSIIRDTSYTIYSASQKIKKQYPKAEIVFPNKTPKILEQKDLTYVKRGNRELKLDLFQPMQIQNNLPVIIFIHGGGWISGNKSMMLPMAQEICLRGYVTAIIEYRLAPEAKYPAAILDIKAAVKWIRENAEKYSIDTNKIALLGCSAGGHLAAFVGATNGIFKFDDNSHVDKYSSNVNAVVDIDGVLDFTDPAESGKDTDPNKPSVGKRWLGYAFKDNPDIWVEASPLTHINKNSAPICFINSSLERFHAGRDEMIEKMNRLDIYSEINSIENSPHSFWLFHPWYYETIEDICKYLNFVFKE